MRTATLDPSGAIASAWIEVTRLPKRSTWTTAPPIRPSVTRAAGHVRRTGSVTGGPNRAGSAPPATGARGGLERERAAEDVVRRHLVRDVDDLDVAGDGEDRGLHLGHVGVAGTEVGRQRDDRHVNDRDRPRSPRSGPACPVLPTARTPPDQLSPIARTRALGRARIRRPRGRRRTGGSHRPPRHRGRDA